VVRGLQALDRDAETPGEPWRPRGAGPNEYKGPEYGAFVTKFDEEIAAEDLCEPEELDRLRGSRVTANARMTHAQIRRHCGIDSSLGDLLQHAMEQLSLSARAYDRILKVARTIADLAGAETIAAPHLLEAIQYRSLDRNLFY
ncbi:MAG TPA: hypothetical protein PKY38_15500, partial [Opitutaceae bacterium]|nr:hypothetical protein [Opitutaceae bacterium]